MNARRMRRAPGLALLVVLALAGGFGDGAAARGPSAPPGWRPHIRSARAYARSRGGLVAFAVRTPSRSWGYRSQAVIPSASVIKAMLLVTYLNRRSVRHRRLGPGDIGLLTPMIHVSDNNAASAVRNRVGNAAVTHLARRVGMRRFHMNPIWGLSHIDAADQSRFFLRLPELVPARHRAFALHLLATVVSYQRWGFGQARPRGWRLYFKGGWGVRGVNSQIALLRRGRLRVAVAILTRYQGSQGRGEETIRGVARRLLGGLAGRLLGRERAPGCSIRSSCRAAGRAALSSWRSRGFRRARVREGEDREGLGATRLHRLVDCTPSRR